MPFTNVPFAYPAEACHDLARKCFLVSRLLHEISTHGAYAETRMEWIFCRVWRIEVMATRIACVQWSGNGDAASISN